MVDCIKTEKIETLSNLFNQIQKYQLCRFCVLWENSSDLF